jgi:hypothetical protein
MKEMGIKVHLYSNLPQFAGNQTMVEVQGLTIRQCLEDLVVRFPGLGPELLDTAGNLLSGIFVSVNLKSPGSENMTRRLELKDELYLIRIVAGG